MAGPVERPLIWIDLEMTGLDPDTDVIVEIAVIVTNGDLAEVHEGPNLVIGATEEQLATMDDVVVEMHTSSGLLDELDGGVTMAEAEQQVLDYIKAWVPEPRRAPLAGNSVGTDRGFLARDMPTLEAYLHYRVLDVSSIKELARRWYPRVYFNSPTKHGGHRALADIRESIEELRYYRGAIFVRPPGPDSATARSLAAEHGGSLSPDPGETTD